MLDSSDFLAVLNKALSRGGTFADLFIEEIDFTYITYEDHKIETLSDTLEIGAGIRIIGEDNFVYGYTNDLSLKNLIEIAGQLSWILSTAASGRGFTLSLKKPSLIMEVEKDPRKVDLESKLDCIKTANKKAYAYSQLVKQVRLEYKDFYQKITIANSEGEFIEDERRKIYLGANVTAQKNGLIQSAGDSEGGFFGYERVEQGLMDKVAKEAARKAVLLLEARPAPAGSMPVIISSSAGGVMIHEACGHGLEADIVYKGSIYSGKIGERVASSLITVSDDATLVGRYGSFAFDDEGTPAEETILIEKGILKGYMYDRFSAIKEKKVSTGNGRRMSYEYPPIVRMTNTFILPGTTHPEEIISSTSNGVLIKSLGGGNVNSFTGDFTFEITEGYLIEKGKITYPIRGATVIGNGPRALNMVELVGNDFGFVAGHCGKSEQLTPITCAQPTLRFSELIVGGIS